MSVTRQYQTYYGIKLNHWSTTWGGITYNELLVKEFPSEYLSAPSYSTSTDVTFIYPTLYKNKYYIDGLMEGHVSIYNSDSTVTYYCSSYGVELRKTEDVPSNEVVLGYSYRTISTASSILPGDYLTLPVFINIDKALVEPNERLLFRFYFNLSTSTDACGVAHANDSSNIDMMIKIPYAPTG